MKESIHGKIILQPQSRVIQTIRVFQQTVILLRSLDNQEQKDTKSCQISLIRRKCFNSIPEPVTEMTTSTLQVIQEEQDCR